jgi:hypothetical protein
VNYVDWSLDSIHDYQCGSKAYNGHQGTDFVLRSFAQMDSGVFVLAAADGVVTFIKDGEFDREKESVIAKGLGNYICISHPNKYYTYYAHLKKNSLLVKPGDSVKSGQKIAEVASSGNSTDPHLHFEVWYDSMYVVDPFKGNCGNPQSLWKQEPVYDTSFKTIDFGIHDTLLTINDLRERHTTLQRPYRIDPKDSVINFWSHHTGLRLGDTLTIAWYDASNQLHFTYDFVMQQDWWYYYFWSYITNPKQAGNWTVKLHRNGKLAVEEKFTIDEDLNSFSPLEVQSDCETHKNYLTKPVDPDESIEIFDAIGNLLYTRNTGAMEIELPSGIYLIRVSKEDRSCNLKIYVD